VDNDCNSDGSAIIFTAASLADKTPMPRTQIKLYGEASAAWRTAFDRVVGKLVAAEAHRLGEDLVECDQRLGGNDVAAHIAEVGVDEFIYWQPYLGLSTSPESGIRRRLNRAVAISDLIPDALIKRVIVALARDVPRDCEPAIVKVADLLGRVGTHFEVWEPKDIRRRILSEFGITCPALQLDHLEQVLTALSLRKPGHRVRTPNPTSSVNDDQLGTLFISYASEDRSFVERLVTTLGPYAEKIWYDRHAILVGESIVAKINGGLAAADFVVAVLSPASVSKPWVQSEIYAAYMRQQSEGTIRLLPVMKERCTLPPLLLPLHYADFTARFEIGLNELLLALRGIRTRNAITAV
jgi:TIR domain